MRVSNRTKLLQFLMQGCSSFVLPWNHCPSFTFCSLIFLSHFLLLLFLLTLCLSSDSTFLLMPLALFTKLWGYFKREKEGDVLSYQYDHPLFASQMTTPFWSHHKFLKYMLLWFVFFALLNKLVILTGYPCDARLY